MKKIFLLGILSLFCLALAGCGNKDAEFKAFTGEFEKVTSDMVAKVEADPSEAGVDAAQAIFDGKKADLKTKWAAIKDARGVQVSQDVAKGFEEGLKRSSDKVMGAMSKITEPEAATKYGKLIKDWGDIVDAGSVK